MSRYHLVYAVVASLYITIKEATEDLNMAVEKFTENVN